jgi:hypothetical protein
MRFLAQLKEKAMGLVGRRSRKPAADEQPAAGAGEQKGTDSPA